MKKHNKVIGTQQGYFQKKLKKKFFGLTQHAVAKHVGRTSLSQNYTQSQRSEQVLRSKHYNPKPEHNEKFWSTPIIMPRSQSQCSHSQLYYHHRRVKIRHPTDDQSPFINFWKEMFTFLKLYVGSCI